MPRLQTLDAIVDLQGTGFLALGRAKRAQDHDQVIAVGFDRTGEPTWSRVLERFRAIEIYGEAGNPALLGAANFVVRVPITGDEGTSAVLGVGREHAVISQGVETGRRNEGSKAGQEVEGVQQYGAGPIAPGMTEAILHACALVTYCGRRHHG